MIKIERRINIIGSIIGLILSYVMVLNVDEFKLLVPALCFIFGMVFYQNMTSEESSK